MRLTAELSHYLLLFLGHRTDLLAPLVVLRPIACARVSIGVVASFNGCGSSVCALCPTLTFHPDEDALLLQRTSGIDHTVILCQERPRQAEVVTAAGEERYRLFFCAERR